MISNPIIPSLSSAGALVQVRRGTDHRSVYECEIDSCSFRVPLVVGGESRRGHEASSQSCCVGEGGEECDMNVSRVGWEWVRLHHGETGAED